MSLINRTYHKLRDRYHEERLYLKQNAEEVALSNLNMLRAMSLVLTILMTGHVLISLFYSNYDHMTLVYSIPCLGGLLLFLYTFLKNTRKTLTLAMYLFITIAFFFVDYLSIMTPDSMASSMVGFFVVVPLIFMDDSIRMSSLIVLYFILFIISSAIFKPFGIFIYDILTVGSFMIIGIVIGIYMRYIKLVNLETKRRLNIMSNCDELTGLFNRHRMIKFLSNPEGNGNHSFFNGIIMLDIDFFKRFNDSYGHMMGDECLRKIGEYLRNMAKNTSNVFFRYGGEEFIAFCYDMDHDQLAQFANDINKGISQLNIPFQNSPQKIVTVSVGFVESNACDWQNIETLVHCADIALYEAKSRGRNTVINYSDIQYTGNIQDISWNL